MVVFFGLMIVRKGWGGAMSWLALAGAHVMGISCSSAGRWQLRTLQLLGPQTGLFNEVSCQASSTGSSWMSSPHSGPRLPLIYTFRHPHLRLWESPCPTPFLVLNPSLFRIFCLMTHSTSQQLRISFLCLMIGRA